MALSEAMKKRIQNAAASQKTGGTTTAAAGGSQSTGLSSAMKDRIRKAASMQQLGTENPGVDDAFLKKFQNDYQKYVYDTQHARNTMTYQSSRDGSYEKRFGAVEKDLADRAKTIRTYLNLYQDSMDSETYKNLTDYMDQIDSVGNDIRKGYASMQDYFSQWETEDDYNAYVDWQKDYDAKAGYDVAAGRQEIEALEKQLADLRLQQTAASFGPRANRDNGAAQYAEQIRQLEQEIARKKQYANQSQYIQKGETLKGVTGNADFGANSGYVSTIDENPAWGMSGVGDNLYEWINNRNGFRDTYERDMARLDTMAGGRKMESPYIQKGYDRMTDQEVAIYNYYYATEGKEKAEDYLHSIQEQLNTRKATELFEGMQGKTGQELVFGVEAGLDQFKSGMGSLINTKDDYIAQSTKQIASGMVREDLEDDSIPMWYNFKTGQWEQQILGSSAGQVAYDAITTSANMAPSILTSIAVGMINPVAGQIAGSALMGASAAGSAYQEKLNAGYDKDQARAYGLMVGASEIVMEKLLGGITKLGGGMISRYVLKNLSAVDNVLARFAKSMGGQILMGAGSEALEEGVQSVLEPFILQAVTGEEASIDWQEAMYSALLGFATGGMFEGADVVYNTGVQNRKAKQQYGGQQQEIVNKALELDKENAFAQKMQGKINKGKNLSGKQIRELLASNQKQITEKDMQKIQAAAEKRLTELGQSKEDVSKIAELATKYATGQELSTADKRLLASSKYGSRVANELMPQNIASGDYSTEWAEEIGTEQVNKAAYNKKALVQQIVDAMASFEDPAQYKALTDRTDAATRFSVSQGEQATVRSTGEAFDINNAEVASIKPNEVTFKTADGNEVSANDIDFADEDQSFLVAAVSGIENITPAAASAVMHDVVDTSKPLGNQLNGIDEAYTYGFNGYSVEDLKAGSYTGSLTETQLMSAYQLGQSARKISDVEADAPVLKMRTAAEANRTAEQRAEQQKARIESDDVEVYFEDGGRVVKFDEHAGKYDDKRMAAVNTAKFLSKLDIGGKYYFFESYENADGQRVYKDAGGNEVEAPNGMYKDADGSIHIDLNAGNAGQGIALFTLGHELTHFVKSQSKKQFKVLGDLVTEAFDKTDLSMHDRVVAKQDFLSQKRGYHVTYSEAFEEVVADAMSTMISDGSFHEKIMEIKVKDEGLFNAIKRFFDKMIAKFRKAYENLTPDQRDAQDIRQMKDMFDKIQTAFAEALVEASDNFRAVEAEAVESLGENAKVETNADGELLLAANERGNVLVYSERTYLDGGREKLDMALRQNGHTDAEIKDTLSYVDDALDYIKILAAGYAKNMGYTNLSDHLVADIVTNVKTGKQVMSAIVNNGDYPVNIDLSLICKKRVAYMNLMSRLIRDGVFDKVNYGGAAIAEVNEILRENGFETACLGCFVESRRLQFQAWAETIVSEWNAEVNKRNPNAENFGFAKGKMETLTDENINELTRELESVKKNDQGNVNLGQGNSVTRMGRLLDALPSLQKKLTVEDLLTPEGLTALRKHDGSLFSIVKSRYGAASPKIVQDFNPYASEIAMLTFAQVKGITNNAVKGAQAYITEVKNEYGKLKKNKDESKADFNQRKKNHEQKIQDEAMRRYLYDIGGARIQSFSDFMIENVFDYIQIFADLAAKRLPLHGYSKEIVAIRLFGMTGAKWNGSLIAHVERSMGKELAGLLPAGTKDGIPVTVDGKDYVIGFDDYARNAATGGKSFIQSIGMKDIVALQLDPRYSPYVGSITIGVSDAQILAMLDSPVFRMVIPYHASGMLPQFAKLVGVDMYNDYTDYQNTTVRQYYDLNGNAVTELKNAKGETVKADTSYAFNAEIQKTKDAKTAANNYLKWCAQRHEVYDGSKLVGYATFNPKFSNSPYGTDFTRHENYYKLLEDFNTYDSVTEASAVQGAVTMNFPSEENRLTAQQMEAYKAALRDTGIFTEKDIEKYAKKADMTFKEIIDAEVGNRANYAATQQPKWESTVKAVEAKLQKDYARTEKNSDREYMAAVKRGDMETAQRMVDEAAKKAGYSVKAYHGTKADFTKFDKTKSGKNHGDWSVFGAGFYFSPSKEIAMGWGEKAKNNGTAKVMPVYLNAENMLPANEPIVSDKAVEVLKSNGFTDEYDIKWTLSKASRFVDFLLYKGYTNLDVQELFKSMGYDGIDDSSLSSGKYRQYVVFNPEQIKSADPVTYDDSGNVIPLSERFKQENDDIRYSDRYSSGAEFRGEINKWNKDGRPKDETFILGATGDVIQGLGAIESDIYMLGDKISTILAEHPEITLEEIKKIPQILENPILILESQNVGRSSANTRMVVFGSVKAKNGLPVTAILDLRPVENNLVIEDMQKVTSAYTKDSNPVRFVQNSNVLYADKKRTAKLLSAIGFQMPISLQHSGFVGSIAYKGPKINMQGVPFANIVGGNSKNSDRDSTGKKLTVEQQEFFKDSKVRDDEGNLKVMYHGTSKGGFNVFDTYGSNHGLFGTGSYFTDSKTIGESYTKKGKGKNPQVYEVYLNIKNPMDMDAAADPAEWAKAFPDADFPENGTNEQFYRAVEEFYADQWMSKWEVAEEIQAAIESGMGYDGITHIGGGRVNADGERHRVYIAFQPEQIKSVANITPTSDPDIRYSERGEYMTNRDLLANAFEGISRNSIEYQMIQDYKGHIEQLNRLETELHRLNTEIRNIRFGKGEYDAEKLDQLESKARRIAKDINRYDKRLLNMEASEPLRKVIERERKKEAQKTKAHVKEIQENKKVRAEQAEIRHKIRKAVRDLDKVLNRGNKKLNVKEDMQNVVTKALKAADILFTDNYGNYDMLRNGIGAVLSDSEEALVKTCAKMLKDLDAMPTDGYDNWQARQEAEKQLRTKMAKLKDVFARERKRLNNTTVSSVLGELADAYASLEKSEQSYVQGAYTEAVHNFLKSLQSEVGGTIVKDMTKDQLESVYAAYKMVLTTVRKANQMFNEDLKQTREQLGNAVIQEVINAGGTHGLWAKGEIAKNQADWNNLKPIWVANRIGSDTFGKLMNGLFKGQYNFAVDVEEAKQFKQSMDQKYNPKNWDAEKLYEFESSTESKFSLNLQQIMSIYAFSKREQAYSHLLNGGFVFESNSTVVVDKKGIKRTYLHDGATSYKLNVETLGEIINALTAEQKAYVDEMQAYLSDVMGAKGNEVSMKLYGIRMFKEKFYFPLRSSGAYMERAKEAELKKEQGQINLVNSGFTHSVKPEAKNPIVLSGFLDVWAEHCNEMSMYHSMVLPMEDFRKVYNYSTIHTENAESASVYQTIQDAYGKAATNYIDQLYRELNAGATVDPRETPFKAWISKFKKAAVMLSASVVVQQFSSVGRAFALIDPDYFAGAKVNSGTGLSAADEMKKYAPVAIIKEIGGFDTGTKGSAKSYIMAEQYSEGERLKGFVKDEQYRSEIMGYLPAKADEVTWVSIWEAVKRETSAKHPKMDVKSEQFLALAGERFSEIIEKTQVYDSVLARSANMRSKGVFMSMATAFMAEPTTTINLLEDALRGRSTKKIARTFGAVAVSIVLNNALASIVYAMRDDDEDETFIEKYFQSFTSGMIDDLNPMSYYPFLKDVYSLFQGYDVERADMSVIADLRDAVKKLIPILGKDTSEMDDAELAAHQKQLYSGLMSFLDAGCSALGVPVKNVRRDASAIINTFKTVRADLTERDTTWRSFWDKVGAAAKDTVPVFAWTSDRTKQDKLYDAIMAGDAEYVSRLKSGYKTDSSYQSAVRKALRENDPRIHEAAVAWNNNELDEYMRIAREIIAEKRFVQDDVVTAIRSEASSITPDPEAAGTSKAKGLFTVDKFASAIAQGDNETARAIRTDVIQTAQQNGKSAIEAEKNFRNTAKSDLREAFLAGDLTEAKVVSALVNYCGENREKAEEYVDEWAFQKKYGFSYDDRKSAYMSGKISAREMKNVLINMGGLTEENAELQVQAYDWNAEGYEDATVAAVRNYIEHCAEYNVPKDVYMKIRKFSNNTENDVDKETGKTINYSAMKRVMAEIHKQDLTAEQKTAIAKSLGWSSKNIRKYKLW